MKYSQNEIDNLKSKYISGKTLLNGEEFILTMDYNSGRINVVVENNIIIESYIG